jgi:phenylacetic acid degradation operon negative regulatory protein
VTAISNTSSDALGRALVGERALTARSVVASTLLGTHPPRMEPGRLVRVGALFGLAEGAVRTALSRMVTAGDLEQDDRGRYVLAGPLLARQARQDESRAAVTRPWGGSWTQAVVDAQRRSPAERNRLRGAARNLRLAELREGVWLRPDNLDPARLPEDRRLLAEQCLLLQALPEGDPAEVAGRLWDLDAWARRAADLRRAMHQVVSRLDAGDVDALAPGFVLSAAVLRHTQADPLLPPDLWARAWPGDTLRADYDRYDAAYRQLLAAQVLDLDA